MGRGSGVFFGGVCKGLRVFECLEFFLQATEQVLTLRKKFTNRQTMKNAWNSNCSSSNCFDPNLLTRTKLSTSFPATLERTSSLCEGRRHSHILQFHQTLVLFAVLFVDCEDWLSGLVESLPGVRRAIFFFSFFFLLLLFFATDCWPSPQHSGPTKRSQAACTSLTSGIRLSLQRGS